MAEAPARSERRRARRLERLEYASQGQLIWWRFRRHRLALTGISVLAVMYGVALFAEFFSPYDTHARFEGFENARPTPVRWFGSGAGLRGPFVYALERSVNRETFRVEYAENTAAPAPIRFFVRTERYKLLGFIPARVRLFGTDGAPVFLFGTDRLGRDVYSRTISGARISLLIGFGGVFVSFVLGCLIGGISGMFGGAVDEVIQRVIEVLLSIPTIPLWMALAAAIPRDWSVTQTYFAITIVLAVVGWAGLARIVRGKLLSLREEDFIRAAKIAGSTETATIVRHLLPNFISYLVVHVTLAIPQTILGETSLSFLGLGMQPPAVSWGVLLKEAQDLAAVAQRSWQLIPGIFVVIAVLMFSFVGDGLRDAADPYQ